MLAQRWMWIAWPAFLAAAVMEMLVFAFVDPRELPLLGDPGWSRKGIYTLALLAFWGGTTPPRTLPPTPHPALSLHYPRPIVAARGQARLYGPVPATAYCRLLHLP